MNEYTRKLSWEKPLDYIEPTIKPVVEPLAKQTNKTEKQTTKKHKTGQSQNGKNKKIQSVQKKKYPFEEEPVDEYEN